MRALGVPMRGAAVHPCAAAARERAASIRMRWGAAQVDGTAARMRVGVAPLRGAPSRARNTDARICGLRAPPSELPCRASGCRRLVRELHSRGCWPFTRRRALGGAMSVRATPTDVGNALQRSAFVFRSPGATGCWPGSPRLASSRFRWTSYWQSRDPDGRMPMCHSARGRGPRPCQACSQTCGYPGWAPAFPGTSSCRPRSLPVLHSHLWSSVARAALLRPAPAANRSGPPMPPQW